MTVDFGYDQHSLLIAKRTFARIQAGIPVTIRGQGFMVEGVLEEDLWAFNYVAVGAVQVSTNTGREVFEGRLGEAEVVIRGV